LTLLHPKTASSGADRARENKQPEQQWKKRREGKVLLSCMQVVNQASSKGSLAPQKNFFPGSETAALAPWKKACCVLLLSSETLRLKKLARLSMVFSSCGNKTTRTYLATR